LRHEPRAARTRAVAAVVAGLVLVAASCAPGPRPPGRATPSEFRPEGRILALGGLRGQSLLDVTLPSGRIRELRLPATLEYLDQAFPYAGGSALVPAQRTPNPRDGYQLWRVSASADAVPVGPALPGFNSFALRGSRALAWRCVGDERVSVLDLASPVRWVPVATGCPAALAPDGRHVAYVQGGTLWSRELPDGPADRLLRLALAPGVRRSHIKPTATFGIMSWGDGGIAIPVGSYEHAALLVRDAAGRVRVVRLSGNFGGMAWQPGGRLLAYSEYSPAQTVDIRTLDTATGATTLVAVGRNYGQFAWSPDGHTLAVARTADVVAFVGLDGRQVGARDIGGVPDAWTP